MKKALLALVLLAGALSLSAQSLSNTLVVESKDGQPFFLRVDGFLKNREAKTRVEVKGLYLKVVNISIVFQDSTFAPIKNAQVPVMRENTRKARYAMNSYTARYQVTAGKRKSKVKQISIYGREAVPIYNPEGKKK